MKKFITTVSAGALFLVPSLAFAADIGLKEVFGNLGVVIATATPVIVALALLAFFWGLANFVLNFSGKDEDKKKGRDMMIYGLIVLFVIVSVWGLVQVLQNTLGVDDDAKSGTIPSVKKSQNSIQN